MISMMKKPNGPRRCSFIMGPDDLDRVREDF